MKILRDLLGILLIYVLYAAVMVFYCYGPDHFYFDDVTPWWAVTAFAVSLGAILLWYILAEWVIQPHAGPSAWYTVWFILFLIVLITSSVEAWLEWMAAQVIPNLDTYPWLHLVGGVGAFYLSSVLFSPLFARTRIWPAKWIRKW